MIPRGFKLKFPFVWRGLFGLRLGLALSLPIILSGCAPRSITLTRSRLLMGHVPVNISIETNADRRTEALQASERAYELAQTLEKQISEFKPDSEISCLNQNAGKAFCALSGPSLELIKTALEIGEKTSHAFDIRFASPTQQARSGAILFKDTEVKLLHPLTRIGVGAIGKGFIVDKMVDLLVSRGFNKVLVDAGGDLRAAGGPWRVAIQIPEAPSGAISNPALIQDEAWSTSGDYEQPGHIRDPRTLKSVRRRGSVTVKAKRLILADALATAFFVLGKEKSQDYITLFPGIEAIWLDASEHRPIQRED